MTEGKSPNISALLSTKLTGDKAVKLEMFLSKPCSKIEVM
jgi:hypothetical protein